MEQAVQGRWDKWWPSLLYPTLHAQVCAGQNSCHKLEETLCQASALTRGTRTNVACGSSHFGTAALMGAGQFRIGLLASTHLSQH